MGTLVDSGLAWPIYNRSITDWVLGDDREWQGTFLLSLLIGGDTGLSDAYLTIKQDPTQVDADALVQLHVTTTPTTSGSIINNIPTGKVTVTFRVLGDALVAASALAPGPYYYDLRGIATPSLATWTFENGTINLVQNVTQTEAAGTPAVLPNSGNPQFRGFSAGIPPVTGIFNKGDWVRNSLPTPGTPSGWVCVVGGTSPVVTWVSDGIVGDDTGV